MNEPDWRSQDTPGFREQRGDGEGRSGGGEPLSQGAGDYGGGRGTDYPATPKGEPPTEAEARQGPIADEHMREGWGGEGENYASGQGPNDRDGGDSDQSRKFRGETEGERRRED